MMTPLPPVPPLLPVACLLCGAPYVTSAWRTARTPYGVLYLCDDCCQRLGPNKAYLMARHFLAVLATLLPDPPLARPAAPPLLPDGDP